LEGNLVRGQSRGTEEARAVDINKKKPGGKRGGED